MMGLVWLRESGIGTCGHLMAIEGHSGTLYLTLAIRSRLGLRYIILVKITVHVSTSYHRTCRQDLMTVAEEYVESFALPFHPEICPKILDSSIGTSHPPPQIRRGSRGPPDTCVDIPHKPRGIADIPSQEGERRPARDKCPPTVVVPGPVRLPAQLHLEHLRLELGHPPLVGAGKLCPRVSQPCLQSSRFELSHLLHVSVGMLVPPVDPLALEEAQSSLLELVPHLC